MYYVLDRFGAMNPCRWIGGFPHISGLSWNLGRRHTIPVPDPLEFELKPLNPDASDHGPELPEYFKGHIPLFREDLIVALRDIGVDNLDLYNAVIVDPDDGKKYTNFKAVNIIGVIAAADMGRSSATVHPGGPVIDVEFDGFAVDERKTGGALMFRLAENTSAILMHEKVVDHLLDKGFDKLEFLDPGEVAL
jgi:hypothetical protein